MKHEVTRERREKTESEKNEGKKSGSIGVRREREAITGNTWKG